MTEVTSIDLLADFSCGFIVEVHPRNSNGPRTRSSLIFVHSDFELE